MKWNKHKCGFLLKIKILKLAWGNAFRVGSTREILPDFQMQLIDVLHRVFWCGFAIELLPPH